MPRTNTTNTGEKSGGSAFVKSAKVTPATVRGLSVPARRSNVMPAGIGPAKLGGSLQGQYPAGTLLPKSVVITQGFHPGHTALDLAGPLGTKIYAPEGLTITQAGKGAFGLDVIGKNAAGDVFTFGHFEAVAPGLVPGMKVPAGTLLGYEGSTFTPPGYSTGPHLHFQENLPGGGAVIPSAQDILNTFVTGLTVPTPSASAAMGGSTGKVATPNTVLLTVNKATVAAADTGGATAAAVNTGRAPVGTTGEKDSAAVTSTPGGAVNSRTNTASSGTSSLTGFLAGHAPLDYAALAVGLGLILFGALLILGQTVKGSVANPVNFMNKELKFLEKQGGVEGLAAKVGG